MLFSSTVITSTRLADIINPIFKIIAFVGASGSGKNSLLEFLLGRDPRLQLMKSVTTRKRRKSDPLEGDPKLEYEFVSAEMFAQLVAQNLMAWHANIHGCEYGTRVSCVQKALPAPHATLMHLSPWSVPKLLELAGNRVCLMYICVPFEELIHRLYERDPDRGEDYFRKRLEDCRHWENEARASGLPFHFISNRDGQIEEAQARVIEIITRR